MSMPELPCWNRLIIELNRQTNRALDEAEMSFTRIVPRLRNPLGRLYTEQYIRQNGQDSPWTIVFASPRRTIREAEIPNLWETIVPQLDRVGFQFARQNLQMSSMTFVPKPNGTPPGDKRILPEKPHVADPAQDKTASSASASVLWQQNGGSAKSDPPGSVVDTEER